MRKRLKLVSGLPTEQVIQRVHRHARQGEVAYHALGYYLRDLEVRGEFRPGFASIVDWAEAKANVDRKLAQQLVGTAAKLAKLPRIDRAFRRGTLPWTKTRIIAEAATPETEVRWLRRAKRHTCAELKRWARREGGEEDGGRREGLGCHPTAYAIHVKTSPLVHETVEKAIAKVMADLGSESTPAEALQRMAEMALEAASAARPTGSAARTGSARPAAPGSPEGQSGGPAPSWRLPYLVVIHVDRRGLCVWKDGEDGQPVRERVSAEDVQAAIRSGARVVLAREVEGEGVRRAIRFGEKGSAPAEERAQRSIPEAN